MIQYLLDDNTDDWKPWNKGFKRCSCCSKCFTRTMWAKLEYVGIQPFCPYNESEPSDLELRNCACGSTLAVGLRIGSSAQNRKIDLIGQ